MSSIPNSWKTAIRQYVPWMIPFLIRGFTLQRMAMHYTTRATFISYRLIHMTFWGVFRIPMALLRAVGGSRLRFGGDNQSPETALVYHPGAALKERIAWIVSFTGVSNEPRVLRQSRALLDAGWSVVVVGYQGHTKTSPDWHFVQLSTACPYGPDDIRYHGIMRRLGRAMCRLPLGRLWRIAMARIQHSNIVLWRHHTESVRDFARGHSELKADLVLAHDFHSCEVAFAVRDHFGAKISVDAHEYARGQLMHDPDWVRNTRPYVAGMHDYYLPRSDSVTTVSSGIADIMNREERLQRPVQVIRSMPFYHQLEARPPGDRLTVLYHGDISYVRGLHMAIASMPLWREEFDLLLRGNGDPVYIEELRQQAAGLGLCDRVRIEGPVPFDQIIPRANEADIGYFVHYDASPQKRFVLPNKFFEYIGAGLALCVSDLPEMARLTREYDIGHLVADFDEREIANSINAFDRRTIMVFKRNALEAAKVLNWDVEKTKLLEHYHGLL